MMSFGRDLSKVSAIFTFWTVKCCDVCYHSVFFALLLLRMAGDIGLGDTSANKGRVLRYVRNAETLPFCCAEVWWGAHGIRGRKGSI